MVIRGIELEGYRNLKKLSFELDEKINIFYGNNAQGKTNILEAIQMACTTKSHRKSRDSEIINFDSDSAHIRLYIKKKEVDYRVDMHLRRLGKKAAYVNGVSVKKLSELLGLFRIVFFSPEDLGIIKSGPAERRRFMDMELCQIDALYLSDLINYNRCLNSRRELLRRINFKNSSPKGESQLFDMLDVWDSQLEMYGKRIIDRRSLFIEELSGIARDIHRELSGGVGLEIKYLPSVVSDDFAKKLSENRDYDIKRLSNSSGPHRDDIGFRVEGVDLRKFGSQGQQRTASLVLKLSEIELVRKTSPEDPVLLLDDVLSELDGFRQNYLLKKIGDIQTLITCTGLDEFVKNRFDMDRVFYVEDGQAREMRLN